VSVEVGRPNIWFDGYIVILIIIKESQFCVK